MKLISKFVNKYSAQIILGLIICLALILRTYNLDKNPIGFFTDEASIGYNAYTIAPQGADQNGTIFPFFIRSFANPIIIYASAPIVALLGLSEFSTRLSSALLGSLTIFAIYFLSKELFSKYKYRNHIALISAFFLAISPWHIHFSRVAFDLIPFVFFATLGLYFFLKALNNIKFLFISTFMFALGAYAYYPARIFIPLFLLSTLIVYLQFVIKNKKLFILNFIFLGILLIPIAKHMFFQNGIDRWNQVDIFTHVEKGQSVPFHILNNYLSHFSLDFLFLKGDVGMPGQFVTRHSVHNMGELYFFQLPLLILGFWYLFSKREKRILSLIMLWFILYPVGSMFTLDESAQATRSIIGIIPFQILSAIGLYYLLILFSKFKKLLNYFSIFSILIIIFASFIYYLNLYFIKYPLYSSGYYGWQYGYRSIMDTLKRQSGNFDEMLITHRFNDGEELLKFYNVVYNCTNCRGMSNPIFIDKTRKQLFAIRQADIDEAQKIYPQLSFDIQQTINLPNGETEFRIGTFVPK